MKIFLITDIHYGGMVNYPHAGGEDYVNSFGEQFKNFFPYLHSEMKQCDLVVNLGDFIKDVSPEKDIETYKEALSFFLSEIPTKHVLGNHDVKNISRKKWAEIVGEEKSYYSFDLGGYHHVILDGNRTDLRSPFYIVNEQLVWLEEDLAKTSLRVIVYCHFPADNQNMDNNYYFKNNPDGASLSNKYQVRRILEKAGNVVVVFSGHTHFYNEQKVNNIIYYTVPSFSENNGSHEPNGKFAIATLVDNQVEIEIKKSERV